jgi:excisionase family DNA binding protein
MPRKASRVFPIMLSISELATALSVTRREIYEANRMGLLPIYKKGARRRVLIEDAVKWVKQTWSRS